jgi:hypothetical protein
VCSSDLLEKIQKLSNWKNFETYFIDIVKQWITTQNIDELYYYKIMLEDSSTADNVYSNSSDSYEKCKLWRTWVAKLPKLFENSTEFQPLIKKMNEIANQATLFDNMEMLQRVTSTTVVNLVPPHAKVIKQQVGLWIKEFVETIEKNYPMLTVVERYLSDEQMDILKDYIKMVNRMNSVVLPVVKP